MSAHPPAEAAVSQLQELFPDKSIEILTSQIDMAQLPDVVERLRNLRGGGIALLFSQVPEVAILHRLRLSRMRGEGVTETDTIPVEEGTFVAGWVESWVPPERPRPAKLAGTLPRRAEKPVRPVPELEVVEGTDLRELDLRWVRRQIARKSAPRSHEAAVEAKLREVVIERGIARRIDGQLIPTLAGMLVYGVRPDLWIEGARAIVSAEGVQRVFAGNIKEIAREVMRWEALVQGVGEELIGPALVNAFAHRDWSANAHRQPVEIERQRDRVEIRNPGSLATGWSTSSAPCNPTIHRLLRRRGLAGKPACGLGAVTIGLERLDAMPFSLVGRDGGVRFVLEMPRTAERVEQPHHDEEAVEERIMPQTVLPATVAICPMASRMQQAVQQSVTMDGPRPPTPPVLPAPPVRLSASRTRKHPADRKAEVLELFCDRGEMTTREVVKALDWTRSTTRAVIAALVEDGEIEGCAEAARSPSQRYRLVDNA